MPIKRVLMKTVAFSVEWVSSLTRWQRKGYKEGESVTASLVNMGLNVQMGASNPSWRTLYTCVKPKTASSLICDITAEEYFKKSVIKNLETKRNKTVFLDDYDFLAVTAHKHDKHSSVTANDRLWRGWS